MAYKIRVARDTLTDGSHAYSVVLSDADGAYLVFDAITTLDAHTLSEGMRDLLTKHTNEDVTIC